MEADGYSYTTTRRKYNDILREIAKYCDNNFGGIYTTEAGDEYLQQKNSATPPYASEWIRLCRNTVIRLNQALLGNFHWHPKKLVFPINPHSLTVWWLNTKNIYISAANRHRIYVHEYMLLHDFCI
mgnify:CR=1 FL=1